MEPIILWQNKWSQGPLVPLYLFFGGLTAGVFIVAVLADLLSTKWRRFEALSKVSSYLSIGTLALAGLFVTLHLGKPERGVAFPLFFTNYESWMTRGGWIVGGGSPLLVLYAALWYFGGSAKIRRIVGVIGLPAAVMLALYTGLLLSNAGFVPLWSKHYLPILFLNSGLTTGLAAAGLVFILAWPFLGQRDGDPQLVVRWLSIAVVIFIVLELFELYAFLTSLKTVDDRVPFGQFISAKGGAHAYEYVTQGELAPWFWWGIVGVGLTIPLVLTLLEFLVRPWARAVATTKFALVLAGGLILRFVIVWGGDLKAPLEFPPQNWPLPPVVGG